MEVSKRDMIPQTFEIHSPSNYWKPISRKWMLACFHGWLHVTLKPRAGVFCKLFNFCLPVGSFTTTFDGETEAIAVAVQQPSLRESVFNRAVVLSNSKSLKLLHKILTASLRVDRNVDSFWRTFLIKFLSRGYRHTAASWETNTQTYLLRKVAWWSRDPTRALSF